MTPAAQPLNLLKRLWPALKWAMFLLVLGFVARHGYVLWTDERWNEADRQARSIGWGWLVLAVVCSLVAWIPSVWYWRRLMSQLGATAPWRQIVRAYYCGHLGKYVPGRAAAIAIRSALLKEAGVPATTSALAALVEGLSYMWAGGLLAMLLYPSVMEHLPQRWKAALPLANPAWRVGLLVFALAVGAMGLALLLRSHLRLFGIFGGRPLEGPALAAHSPVRATFEGAALFLAAWWIQGLTLGLTIRAVSPDPIMWSDWPFWTGAISVALVGAFAILIVPGGLGIREGLLMELLSGQLGPHNAVLAALLSRGVSLAGEILISGALYYGINGSVPLQLSDGQPENDESRLPEEIRNPSE